MPRPSDEREMDAHIMSIQKPLGELDVLPLSEMPVPAGHENMIYTSIPNILFRKLIMDEERKLRTDDEKKALREVVNLWHQAQQAQDEERTEIKKRLSRQIVRDLPVIESRLREEPLESFVRNESLPQTSPAQESVSGRRSDKSREQTIHSGNGRENPPGMVSDNVVFKDLQGMPHQLSNEELEHMASMYEAKARELRQVQNKRAHHEDKGKGKAHENLTMIARSPSAAAHRSSPSPHPKRRRRLVRGLRK
ncbi:uncharacterized protein K452DRAFT_312769 [Aplosporella prunicola CBS 121167]|uniref:Uncharacterized protein n=1 Tax=Aplosporella prunicola CBS 121167 TaxID=1176127 RepID=A0A6A6B2K4_9PEZI|nr:uncharacterized protein K452DRAFT_312769 [Aplosporella prunicola CBS 121167]KAF2136961.1 hypothetical protein K452DRAFT_312769 [Aplosporella prunicola CBS 121167]